MAIISIPQGSSQEINALIEAAQEEDTIIFDAGLYMLDGAIRVPSNRTIYAPYQIFQRKPGCEEPIFTFTGENAQILGDIYTAPGWVSTHSIFDTHEHTPTP